MKKLIAVAAIGGLVALATPTQAAPKASKEVVVFEDKTGDAGNQDSGVPGFDQAGFDLVSGAISSGGGNVVFTVTHAAMPPPGTLPEAFRFLWHFQVDGHEYRFTVKSLDVGKPDVVSQNGTERIGQMYTNGVFRLEECTVEATAAGPSLAHCPVKAYLEGKFDAASKTFTITAPMKELGAKPGSVIGGGTSGAAGTGCQICWIPHYAERSLTPYTIIDSAAQGVVYKIPK